MQTAAGLYNNYISVYVLMALNQLDVLQNLSTTSSMQREEDRKNDKITYLLNLAHTMGIIIIEGDKVRLTEYGENLKTNVGFFTWAAGGYAALLKDLAAIAKGVVTDTYALVDGKYVAEGSHECNKSLMAPIFNSHIKSVEYNIIADLGCGNAGRLINFMNVKAGTKGIGIDISKGAIELAQDNVKKANMNDRIQLYHANVFDEINDTSKVFPKVDTVTCFMMFHDLLNIDTGKMNLFDYLNRAFPDATTYIIADTVKSSDIIGELPIFTMGFELIHKFQDIQLFTLEYYTNYFKNAGFEVEQPIPFGVPNTYIFILKRSI